MTNYLLFCTKLYSLDILRPLGRAAAERGFQVAWFTTVGKEYLREGERVLDTAQQVLDWKPDVVLVPGNWVPPFFPGIKVQVFHGFPVEKPPADRNFRIRGVFDLYCTQGPTSTGPFSKLAEKHGYFRVQETGWSKVDPLFQEEPAPLALEGDRPIVLFGSTFTERMTAAPHLIDAIARMAAEGRWQWLVTLHPKLPAALIDRYRALEGPSLRFIETPDLLPAMKAADVMLCDTSSISTEFMLQHRPLVTFRGVNPGEHQVDVLEVDEVEGALASALEGSDGRESKVRHFVSQMHPYRDGRSSERAIEACEGFLREGRTGLKRKPLSLLRKWRARRKLGYWGPGS